ncbi:MAG: glycoside hydrolase family 108 protein [Parashewanella sp.]
MSELQNRLIEELIEREGGYVNDPTDRGGETNYGITKAVARGYGFKGEMRDLPYELAFHIYVDQFWTPLKLDAIALLSEALAEQLFDFGVNSGTSRAAKALQQVLNVLNQQATLYPDLTVDGVLGTRTLLAIKSLLNHRKRRGCKVLVEAIRAQRIAFCIEIAANDETQEKYQFGWLKRIIEL